MKYCRIQSIILSLLLLCSIIGNGCRPSEIDIALEQMTLKDKVGQLFMVGNFRHERYYHEFIKDYHIGNIFLGYRDINHLGAREITQLTSSLQAFAMIHIGLPLLIATDQEGGKTSRVNHINALPSQHEVGTTMTPAQACAAAYSAAIQLRAIGINTNFSPVADIDRKPTDYLSKMHRTFAQDTDTVTKYTMSYLKGYRQGNLIGCIKHFPGYGNSIINPHHSLPKSPTDLEYLTAHDLVPYKRALRAKAVDMVMTAHLAFPKITGSHSEPATLSRHIMTDILRTELGFEGVLVTDDLNMGSIPQSKPADEIAIACINAGVDLLLYVGKKDRIITAWQGIYDAVERGEITRERLDESVRRILIIKHKYLQDKSS